MVITIEGLDGCGKHTQAKLLGEYLKSTKGEGNVIELSYPKYDSECSIGVRKFLNGDFGTEVNEVNPYTISTFYALDRFADYAENWGKLYSEDKFVIADRYVQSNMLYQLARLHREEWNQYINWISDLEFKYNGLPKADLVIYLSVPIEVSQKLMTERYQGDDTKKDIYEKDMDYLLKCSKVAEYLIDNQNWKVVNCTENGKMRDKEDIADEIKAIVRKKERVANFVVKPVY